jgi:IS1 family transposase
MRCGTTFSDHQPLSGVRIDFAQSAKVVHLLAETMGIRAISRFTGLDLSTVLNILESAGEHCARLMDAKVRNVNVSHVQADEVFSYVGQKPNGRNKNDPERGEIWTFMSIAQKEKLIINYRVSKRTGDDAIDFLTDLKSRLACRIQLTTDSFRGYVAVFSGSGGVQNVFGNTIDYATETKKITKDPNYVGQRAYFAPKTVKVTRKSRFGMPDMAEATTNHAERTNLSLRTFTRRFVRCTINFSKKRENHNHAVAIFVAFFNFCRVHKSLEGKTPAMAAGLTDHVWSVSELLTSTI